VNFERLELAGLGLLPKFRVRDLVDETRIARVGLVDEINIGKSPRLRGRQCDHEKKVRVSRAGEDDRRSQRQQANDASSHGFISSMSIGC